MKQINILTITTVALLFTFQACKKREVFGNFDSLGVGSYLTLEKTNKTTIDYSRIGSESVSIDVKEFGSAIAKVIVYVTQGNANLNKSTWKKIKEYQYGGSTLTLNITASEMATALGITTAAMNPGTNYTLYNEVVTKDGVTYNAVNTVGALASNPNYRAVMTWSANVVCPFDPTGFAGNFRVREDEWADWGAGDVVTVTAATANTISLRVYPNPAYGTAIADIVVNINPATGAATVSNQKYGRYGSTEVSVTSVGTSNFVFACTGTIDLRLNHHVPGATSSSYGTYWLRLTKL
ncbi:MAG: hypothetical protein KGZ74_15675 [Chitinophagaceae bacterium]|nr:hypothetical protein [Chitinophagaceae bacterium]